MKKIIVMMFLAFSTAVMAGPGHKHDNWAEKLGLTEAQSVEMKSIKKAHKEKLYAYKKQLAAEQDKQFAEILSEDQMAQLKSMRKNKEKHMAAKKHKKHKKGRSQKSD